MAQEDLQGTMRTDMILMERNRGHVTGLGESGGRIEVEQTMRPQQTASAVRGDLGPSDRRMLSGM